MRDADLTNGWSGAADGTLEDRQYYSSNWRGDVVAILDDAGRMIEQVRYTPYGVPFALPGGDSDSDGDWDAADSSQISTWISGPTYNILGDTDLDGDVDTDDAGHANTRAGSTYQTLGWRGLSSAYCANRKGYASYEHDAAAPATLAHVRYRVYNFTLGRWTQRDPAGYVDGPNLYGYVGARAVLLSDPDGMKACGVIVGDSGCGGTNNCVAACIGCVASIGVAIPSCTKNCGNIRNPKCWIQILVCAGSLAVGLPDCVECMNCLGVGGSPTPPSGPPSTQPPSDPPSDPPPTIDPLGCNTDYVSGCSTQKNGDNCLKCCREGYLNHRMCVDDTWGTPCENLSGIQYQCCMNANINRCRVGHSGAATAYNQCVISCNKMNPPPTTPGSPTKQPAYCGIPYPGINCTGIAWE